MKKSAAKKETPKKSQQGCGEEGRCPQEEGGSQEEGRQGSGEPGRLNEATVNNIRRRGLSSLRRVPLTRPISDALPGPRGERFSSEESSR